MSMMTDTAFDSIEGHDPSTLIHIWPPWFNTLLLILYISALIFGTFGNLITILVVYKVPRMHRKPIYLFVCNLAVADLLVIYSCIPVNIFQIYQYGSFPKSWTLGVFACKTLSYMQGVSVNVSVYTLVAMAIERYYAICQSMKLMIRSRQSKMMIASTWFYALVIILPWAMYFNVAHYAKDVQVCTEVWPTPEYGKAYYVGVTLSLSYLIPVIVIYGVGVKIYLYVHRRRTPGEPVAANLAIIQRSKLKVAVTTAFVANYFCLSWLPLYAAFTLIKFDYISSERTSLIIGLFQFIALSNSTMNPVIYALRDKKFWNCVLCIIKQRSIFAPIRDYDIHGTTLRARRLPKVVPGGLPKPTNRNTISGIRNGEKPDDVSRGVQRPPCARSTSLDTYTDKTKTRVLPVERGAQKIQIFVRYPRSYV